MAFLQVKNNLGDVQDICEAQKNLGLLSMAYQSSCNVDIKDGDITISKLRLKAEDVRSNYILFAKNDYGDIEWKELAVASWLNTSPSNIRLSTLCNDIHFITNTEFESSIENQILTLRDDIIGDRISVSNLHIHSLSFDSSSLNENSPSILLNTGDTSNVEFSKIEQNKNSNSEFSVSSSRVVNEIYLYAQSIENKLPSEGASYMISTNNLSDLGFDREIAVSNLGLNDSFYTNHLTLNRVTLPSEPFDGDNGEFYLMKSANSSNLGYRKYGLIHDFLNNTPIYPASASNVNVVYNILNNDIQTRLVTENCLDELVVAPTDGSINPFRERFANNLRNAGVCNVSFTANYYDLINKPIKLSGFSNTDFNDETLFIYGKCNLLDLENKEQAMCNLGISKVGRTGNFHHLLNLPKVLSNIVNTSFPDGVYVPNNTEFLMKNNFLHELQTNSAYARSNLGLGDMSTFGQYNVVILDGDITVTDCVITSNLSYLRSNVSLDHAGNQHIFLKCTDSYGRAVWDQLPHASENILGISYITSNFSDTRSNACVSVSAISNIFFNNDQITNLVPLATDTQFGLVLSTDDYKIEYPSESNIINSIGISNLFHELTTSNTTSSNVLASSINTLSNDFFTELLTLSNLLSSNTTSLSNDFFQEMSNNLSTQTNLIHTKLENINVSNVADFDFLQISSNNEGNIKGKQISLNFSPRRTDRFLEGTGIFKEITPTTLQIVNSLVPSTSPLSNDITIYGNDLSVSANTIYIPGINAGDGIALTKSFNNITITNTGLSNVESDVFTNTGGLLGLRGAILDLPYGSIYNTVITPTSSNTYLYYDKYLNTITFAEIPVFSDTAPGLVPNISTQDQSTKYFLRDDGWCSASSLLDNLATFSTCNDGLVPQIDNGLRSKASSYFLNARGDWTPASALVADNNAGVTSISVNGISSNALTLDTTTGDVRLNFSSDNSNYYVLSYNGTYEFRNPFDLIYNLSRYDSGEASAPNFYLNASGNFSTPPTAKDFSVQMSLNGSNLQIVQSLGSTDGLPASDFTCNVIIRHTNIDGLNYNYLNRSNIVYYNNTQHFVDVSNDLLGTYLTTIFNNITNHNSRSNYVFTTSATSRYVELYTSNLIYNNVINHAINHDSFTSDTVFSKVGLSNYVATNYINQSYLPSTTFQFNNVNDDTLMNNSNMIITAASLSNYIKNKVNTLEAQHSDGNVIDYVLNQSESDILVDISTLSNVLYNVNGIIQNEERFTENQVLSSVRMSNYVASNYINTNRRKEWLNGYTYQATDIFSVNGTIHYAKSNYIKQNLIENSDLPDNNHKIPTCEATSNYINSLIVKKDSFGDFTVNDKVPTLYTTSNMIDEYIEDHLLSRVLVVGQNYSNYLATLNSNQYLIVTGSDLYDLLNFRYYKVNSNNDNDNTFSYSDGIGHDNTDNQITTVTLLKSYVAKKIDQLLDGTIYDEAGGGGTSFTSVVCSTLEVHNSIKFMPYDDSRINIVAEQMFMTVDVNGYVEFKKVDHLSGHDSNVTREEDDYSIVTGEHVKTFNRNQFVCGQYNLEKTIYSNLEYIPSNNALFVVGAGSNDSGRANGFEVHDTGEVYVRSNLILGNKWRLSFDDSELRIQKYDDTGKTYITKHIFT